MENELEKQSEDEARDEASVMWGRKRLSMRVDVPPIAIDGFFCGWNAAAEHFKATNQPNGELLAKIRKLPEGR